MNKKFIVDKIFTETLVNEITKMPYTIHKPVDKDGKLFSNYIKEVPDVCPKASSKPSIVLLQPYINLELHTPRLYIISSQLIIP